VEINISNITPCTKFQNETLRGYDLTKDELTLAIQYANTRTVHTTCYIRQLTERPRFNITATAVQI